MTISSGGQRIIFINAVRALSSMARSQRASLPASAPERHFLLGVEAAATEVLRPESRCARDEVWLDRERPAFREGYLRASLLLATAMTAPEVPARLPLPDFVSSG